MAEEFYPKRPEPRIRLVTQKEPGWLSAGDTVEVAGLGHFSIAQVSITDAITITNGQRTYNAETLRLGRPKQEFRP